MENLYGKDSKWIWYEKGSNNKYELVYFRKSFTVNCKTPYLYLRVSADSRYKLYVNGKLVSVGPCKGNDWITYYESIDVSGFLHQGKNVIAAEVLHLKQNQPYFAENIGLAAVSRTTSGAFILDGVLLNESGQELEDVSTDSSWKATPEKGISFFLPVSSIFTATFECFNGSKILKDWNMPEYNDTAWGDSVVIVDSYIKPENFNAYGEQNNNWELFERPIPQLFIEEKSFKEVTKTDYIPEKLKSFIEGKNELEIPAGSQYFFEMDAGELTTAYCNFFVAGGRGASIKVIYSECYEEYKDGRYVKGVRDNSEGVLRGDYDIIEPGGKVEEYETFWFRTFRFVRVEIKTAEDALTLKKLFFKETGYPLMEEGNFISSDSTHSKLWDISLRTLKRCMHETYEDCPYYEQLQYTMDTRLQILFNYQLSADDRLARKAINDFHSSIMPNGLLQSRYPSVRRQIIPGFCLHWIYMLEDHLMYFGDINFIKRYRPTMDSVLDWFDRKINGQGLVGKTEYWSFVDWVEGWDINSVPRANRTGPMTVYNMMYIKALKCAAHLNEVTGRKEVGAEYRARAEKIKEAIIKNCWNDDRKLFMDGPGIEDYSQHAQVWAVLTDVVEADQARELMERVINENIAKVSYAMSFYLFRALEKVGLYEEADKQLDAWRALADLNLTTWVEDPVTQRSECHGWGAVPLYEFPAVTLGVRPAATGYGKIQIKPHIGKLDFAKGTVCTVKGNVSVDWKVKEGSFHIEISGPDNVLKEIELPDGKVFQITEGKFQMECAIRRSEVK